MKNFITKLSLVTILFLSLLLNIILIVLWIFVWSVVDENTIYSNSQVPSNFYKVDNLMTVSEVEEIIGKPFYCTKDSNCYYSKKRGRWIFNNDWTSYTITYKDGKVVRKYIYANE